MVLNVVALDKLVLRLEVSHVIFGGLCFGRVMYHTAQTSEESGHPLIVPGKLLFFMFVTFMMLFISVLMFLARLLEKFTGEGEKCYRSLFEVLLYGFGCLLYFTATMLLIIHIVDDTRVSTSSFERTSFIGAAMFASWNTITYLVSLCAFVKLRNSVRLEIKDSDSAVLIS